MMFRNKNSRAADGPEEIVPEDELRVEETTQSLCDAADTEDPADTDDTPDLFFAKVLELEQERDAEKDRCLRLFAELENLRKRSARELADERKYSGMEVIRDLLPVMDNLQRAIDAAENQAENQTESKTDDDPLLTGVRMVFQQFESALARNHCTRIEALHEPFDPRFHQAISRMPSDEYPENTVIMVTQDGFLLVDRVVRPSQVIVSMSAPKPAETSGSAEGE